jgi:hypothetical protein
MVVGHHGEFVGGEVVASQTTKSPKSTPAVREPVPCRAS